MREFHYSQFYSQMLQPDIVALLTRIHEFKGEQAWFIETKAGVLTNLMEVARIQSTEASNKIEGIYTSDERLKKLVQDKTTPRTRNEQEIAGYRDVLATICESFDYIPPKPAMILQLHQELYKFSGVSYGGKYKTTDDESENKTVRFHSVSVQETPKAVEALCQAYEEAVCIGEMDPLILIPMFVLDFLCIHPFNGGNGLMSRLLTLLLLYRAGYIVGKYISIEKLIKESKETYYETLRQSSLNWQEAVNDYAPFVRYTLEVVAAAYQEFSVWVKSLSVGDMSKPDRIRKVIEGALGKITKAEIAERCPDISQITIQRTLADLQKSGEILKLSGGRYSAYIWNSKKS